MFGKEANSTSRSFALQCLASGMRREDDVRFISRTRVIPRLLPILDVLLKQDGKINLEEDVICLLEAVIKIGLPGAHYLVEGGGVVDWAWARLSKGQQVSSFEPFNLRILSVMHVALERMVSEDNNKGKGNEIGMLLYSLATDVLAFGIKYANVKGIVEMALRLLLVARYKTEPLLIPSAVLNQLRGEIDSHEDEWSSSSLFGSDEEMKKRKKLEEQQKPETSVWYPKPSRSVEGSLLLQLLCLKRAMVTSHQESVECTLQLLQWALMQLNHHHDLDLSSCFLCRVNELLLEEEDSFTSHLLASNDPNVGYGILNLLKGLLSLGLQSKKNGIAALKPVVFLVTSFADNELPDSLCTRLLPSPFIHTIKRCRPILKHLDEPPPLSIDEDGHHINEYVASAACGVLLSIMVTDKKEMGEKFLLEDIFINLNPERCVIPPRGVIDELEGLLLSEK